MISPSSLKTGTEEDLKFSEDSKPVQLAQWNPMLDAYSSKAFNSYFKPTLDANFLEKYKSLENSSTPLESFSPTKGDRQEVKLYLSNIPLSLSKEGLRGFLAQAAPIQSVKICHSKDPERGTTFGFATVESPKDAENIIRRFNNFSFGTRSNLYVKLALSSEEKDRQREIQKEEEDFYLNLYKNAKGPEEEEEEEEEMNNSATRNLSSMMNDETPVKKQNGTKRNDRLCICCNKAGSKQCARCKACYCSVDCQRIDWAKHQTECLLVGSTPEATPVSNDNIAKSVSKSDKIDENSLMLSVDDMDIEEHHIYCAGDLKAPKPLDSNVRVMVYVVEDLVIKGQVISESDTTAFITMSEKLANYMKVEPELFQKGACREGMLVIVAYGEEICRATITKYIPGSEEAEIYFIDFGNKEICNVSDLKPMPKFAIDLPMQCREFTLFQIPNNINAHIKEQLNDRLKELVFEKLLNAETRSSPDGSYQLIVTSEEEGIKVNESMLSLFNELSAKSVDNGIDKAVHSSSGQESNADISIEPLPKEQDFRIVVTDVKSPTCFFAQVAASDLSNMTELASLSERLQNLPVSSPSSFSPTVGLICVAFFPEDQMWYRASIECINNDGTVRVSYFDYGNSADLELCFLRPIDAKFTSLPKQARKFSVYGIQSSSPDGKWSDESIALFREKVSSEPCDALRMSVVDDVCQVQVYLPSEDCCADELLLKHGYAKSASSTEKKDSSPVLSSVPEAMPTKAPKVTLRPTKVEPNGELRVVVVHVEDPDSFYVNIAERENIEKLMEYGVFLHETPLVQLKNPVPGDICCALYTDGDWYRAKVVSTQKDNSVVFFCDYGNESEIPNASLKVMPEEVTSLPAQAVKVKLHDVLPVTENQSWSDIAKEFFSGLILNKLFALKVVNLEGDVVVATLISDEDASDIAGELVKVGVARSCCSSLPAAKICNNVSNGKTQGQPQVLDVSEPKSFTGDKPEPVVRDELKPAVRDESKPVVRGELKPAVRDECKPIVTNVPNPIVKNVPKSVIRSEPNPEPVHGAKTEKHEDNVPHAAEKIISSSVNGSVDVKANKNRNTDFSGREENEVQETGFNYSSRGNNQFYHKRGSRGRGRGRGRGYSNNFQNRNENGYNIGHQSGPFGNNFSTPYPPVYPYPFPFMYPPNAGFPPPHPGMQYPFPYEINRRGDWMGPNEQEGDNDSTPQMMQRQVSWQKQTGRSGMSPDANGEDASPSTMNSYRGAGNFRGRGARGGINKSQSDFNNTGFKQHSRLPQEKTPSEYFSGANINFVITNIDSPSRFYIQDEKNQGKDKLSQATYEKADAIASVEESMVCAAFAGGYFYRAVVDKVYPEKVSVRLADSGKQEIVYKSSLKRLIPADFKRPFLAVRCVLYNAGGYGRSRWSSEAINYFSHKVALAERRLQGVVRGEVPSGLMVSIRDPENSKAFLIDDMVKQGFAYYMH